MFCSPRTLQPYRCGPPSLRIVSRPQQDSGTARAIGEQSGRQQGAMTTTAAAGQQQQAAGLRSRRALVRDKDPVPDLGMDASCCMVPGVLRRLIELPSPPLSRHQLKRLEEHRYHTALHRTLAFCVFAVVGFIPVK